MNSSLRNGLLLVTAVGTMMFPGERVRAADNHVAVPEVGTSKVQNETYSTGIETAVSDYLAPTIKGEYFKMAFTNVDADTFLFIRSEPSRESEWVGKLYPGSASEIIGPVGEWTRVQSGSVTGYVYTKYIITGEEAWQRADEIMSESSAEHITEAVPCAESREEEEARLAEERKKAEEEAARQAAEQAANVSTLGQQIVDYACQFIGNPYVWGGTSLTNGADCSGFVQAVYANFGISLPRTTWDMVGVGYEVSYDEALPGDIVLYDGHVGLYMGDGNIVNAMNETDGIGICSAQYAPIVTIRRVL